MGLQRGEENGAIVVVDDEGRGRVEQGDDSEEGQSLWRGGWSSLTLRRAVSVLCCDQNPD